VLRQASARTRPKIHFNVGCLAGHPCPRSRRLVRVLTCRDPLPRVRVGRPRGHDLGIGNRDGCPGNPLDPGLQLLPRWVAAIQRQTVSRPGIREDIHPVIGISKRYLNQVGQPEPMPLKREVIDRFGGGGHRTQCLQRIGP